MWVLCCGGSLGAGSVAILERADLERGPPGWTAQASPIPGLAQWVEGAPATASLGWPLDGHRRITAPGPAHSISVEADLGRDGLLILALPTRSGGEEVRLQISSGRSPEVVLLRPDDMQRQGNRVPCEPAMDSRVSGEVSAILSHDSESLTVSVNGQTSHCGSPTLAAQPVPSLQSGLARIHLSSITLDDEKHLPAGRSWFSFLLAALAGGTLVILGVQRRPGLGAAAVPLLATLPLALGDMEGWLQGARIHSSHPLWSSLALPLGASLVVGLGIEMARASRRDPKTPLKGQGLRCAGAGALAFAGLSALAGPDQIWAILAFGGVGAGLSVVLWANCRARDLPAFNWVSLGAISLAVLCGELGVRGTASGRSWAGLASPGLALESEASLSKSFSMLESDQVHTDYPDQGYPVSPPPRGEGLRVVALGGSSTGGAFVADNLDAFFPNRLDDLLGEGVQVLNQGVGGWTTLHIRRYVETRLADLDPDIGVVYVGHNDLLTRSRLPYRDLHRAFSGSQRLSGLLGRSWLYRGTRFALESSLGRRDGAAVPIEHARENLEALATAFGTANSQLLLVPEVVTPPTPELLRYGHMMKEVAELHGHVAWFDPAETLRDPANGRVFLDDVHLSERGHQVIARELRRALASLSWIPAVAVRPSLENDND
jgi:lysophospholipase L1-like esterase